MEETFRCPYDMSHIIYKPWRVAQHLRTCEKNHPHIKLERCNFDATHFVPAGEMDAHLETCPSCDLHKHFFMQNGGHEVYESHVDKPLVAVKPQQRLPSVPTGPIRSSADVPQKSTGPTRSSADVPQKSTGPTRSSADFPQKPTGPIRSSADVPQKLNGPTKASPDIPQMPKSPTRLSADILQKPKSFTRSSADILQRPDQFLNGIRLPRGVSADQLFTL